MLVPQRQVLEWVKPSPAVRYEIFAPDLGLPQAVLTIDGPLLATLQTRHGTYTFRQQSMLSTVFVTDADGSDIARVNTGWWGHRSLQFHDGRELRFRPSNLIRSRWLWSSGEGVPRAIVRQNRIFFSPNWPVREGFGALLAGLSIYFLLTKPSLFSRV